MLHLVISMLLGLLSTLSSPQSSIDRNLPIPISPIEETKVRQVDLAKTPVLNKILKDVISRRDSTELSKVGYYLFSVKEYKSGILVKVVEIESKILYYAEDGYDGYVITKSGVPVIFRIRGELKLKYKSHQNMKTFKMEGKNSPRYVTDPDEWWFFVSGKIYVEVDDWTGISMWTNTLEEYE